MVSGCARCVLAAVTTTSRGEVDWLTEQMGRVFPEEWERFARASDRRDGERLVEAYARRLAGADLEDRRAAAAAWDRWEAVHVSLGCPRASARRCTRMKSSDCSSRRW